MSRALVCIPRGQDWETEVTVARLRNSGHKPGGWPVCRPAAPAAVEAVQPAPGERPVNRVSVGVLGTLVDENYRLGGGDRLRILFYDRYDRDDLNGEYVIGESGQLRLPRIGEFDARDKTRMELEREIRAVAGNRRERLGYFSIDIVQCRPFYVAGLVNRPGAYPYVPGYTVLHALTVAGGLYRSGAEPFGGSIPGRGGSGQVVSYRIMRRSQSGEPVFEQASETAPVMPGDVIQIECLERDRP